MILSTAAFSLMNVGIRAASAELHTTVIVLLRNFLALLFLLPFLIKAGPSVLPTKRFKDHFWRGAIGFVGMQTWFYSIATLPLNQATALSFTAPLFTSLFAVIFLKEHASRTAWAAMFVGFLGTLIILRPNPHDFDWNALFVIGCTSIWATVGMMLKSLTRTEPPLRIITYMSFIMMVLAIPFAVPHWQMPTPHLWLVLLAVAGLSTLAHWSLVKAYALADVVQIMPFDFLRLVFTAVFAWAFFHETSDAYTWAGAAIIVASVVYNARRESLKKAVVYEEVDLPVPKR